MVWNGLTPPEHVRPSPRLAMETLPKRAAQPRTGDEEPFIVEPEPARAPARPASPGVETNVKIAASTPQARASSSGLSIHEGNDVPPAAASFRQLPSLNIDSGSGSARSHKFDRAPLPRTIMQILADCRENWRRLAKLLIERAQKGQMRTILIASCLPGEGCTSVALALTAALAHQGSADVLLWDGDISGNGASSLLKLPVASGWPALAAHQAATWSTAVWQFRRPPFAVLAAGREDAGRRLDANALTMIGKQVKEVFDLVIVDAGSIFGAHGRPIAMPAVDAAMLVRQPNRSTEHLLEQADDYLLTRGVDCLGVIENAVEVRHEPLMMARRAA